MRYRNPIRLCLGLLLSFFLWLIWMPQSQNSTAHAVGQNTLQTVHVDLGTVGNQLQFVPSQLTFKTGRLYKLVLNNPSEMKHYFTAKDFADASWTQKVEAGQVEIKGAVHELELKPNAVAEWFFNPMKPGQYELHCTIPGHAEAGMVGTITITS